MTREWQPAQLPRDIADLISGWPNGCFDDVLDEFRSYWLERGHSSSSWDKIFHKRIATVDERVMQSARPFQLLHSSAAGSQADYAERAIARWDMLLGDGSTEGPLIATGISARVGQSSRPPHGDDDRTYPMTRLREDVKRRIVEHLACYRRSAEVAELILEEFGIALSPRHIRAYDPLSGQFSGGPHWHAYHRAVRERYEQQIGDIAIAHPVYRLLQLQALLDDAMDRGHHRLAMKVLAQAAREMGNG